MMGRKEDANITCLLVEIRLSTCVRACRGGSTMPALSKFVSCEVLAWLRGGHLDEVMRFTLQAGNVERQFQTQALVLEIGEVDRGVSSWTEICFYSRTFR